MSGGKRKTDAAKKQRDILFPLLREASNYIQDGYWKNFFIDMSKGKLARKIHVDPKYVSHNSKKASFSYQYDDKTPESIATDLRKLISDTLSIYSDKDIDNERENIDQRASEFRSAKNEDSWKKVRHKKMRDHLITNFVIDQKAALNLTWQEARYAYQIIICALYEYRTHDGQEDIIMENGSIQRIADITISKALIANHRAIDDKEPALPKKVNLDKEWFRLCKRIAKRSKELLCMETDDVIKKKRACKNASSGPVSKKRMAEALLAQTNLVSADDIENLLNKDADEVENDEEEAAGTPDEDEVDDENYDFARDDADDLEDFELDDEIDEAALQGIRTACDDE